MNQLNYDKPSLLAVLATLAICPTAQSVETILYLSLPKNYSDEEWQQICECARDRLGMLGTR